MGYNAKPPPPPPPPPPTTSPMAYLMAQAPAPPRPNPPMKDDGESNRIPRPVFGVLITMAALAVFGVAMAHNEHELVKPLPVEQAQPSPEFVIHDTPKEFACSRNNTAYADWKTKSVYMLGTSGTKTKWGIVTVNSDKPVVVISDSAKNEKCGFVHKSG